MSLLNAKTLSSPEFLSYTSGPSTTLKIPRGGLIELSSPPGGGKTEVFLRFLQQNPGLQIAWLDSAQEGELGMSFYGAALPGFGVSLDSSVFLEVADARSALWSVQQILRSGVFDAIVLYSNFSRKLRPEKTLKRQPTEKRNRSLFHTAASASVSHAPLAPDRTRRSFFTGFDDVSLRRLQIEAERARAMVWVLTESPLQEGTWAFSLRLEVNRSLDPQSLGVKIIKQRWSSLNGD